MSDHNEKVIDLTAALDRRELVPVGTPIDSVYINGEIPVGVTVKIFLGSKPGIVLRSFANLEICREPERQGVYVSTVGASPQLLSILVGTGLYVQGA